MPEFLDWMKKRHEVQRKKPINSKKTWLIPLQIKNVRKERSNFIELYFSIYISNKKKQLAIYRRCLASNIAHIKLQLSDIV